MGRLKDNPDPIAVLVGGVIEILAIFGVFERLGFSGDEVAKLGGAAIMVAAGIRTWLRWRSKPPAPPGSTLTTTPDSAPRFTAPGT